MTCPSCGSRTYVAFNETVKGDWWYCTKCGDAGPADQRPFTEHETQLVKKIFLELLNEGKISINEDTGRGES